MLSLRTQWYLAINAHVANSWDNSNRFFFGSCVFKVLTLLIIIILSIKLYQLKSSLMYKLISKKYHDLLLRIQNYLQYDLWFIKMALSDFYNRWLIWMVNSIWNLMYTITYTHMFLNLKYQRMSKLQKFLAV